MITYIRVSVTDRCNQRCTYCMPPEGVPMLRHEDILSYDEITEVVREAAAIGVNKVRITGGEPLVRKGVVDLVQQISHISGIHDLGMTTNGMLLDKFANPLRMAGLMRVNISLDTTDPDRYREITRGGDLSLVLKGIEAAVEAGLTPVKLNCVIQNSSDEPDAQLVKAYALKMGFQVRFIHQMDLEKGYFRRVEGGEGGDCARCNRLRLTSNGIIKPCLFSNSGFSVREFGAHQALLKAIGKKPESGGEANIHSFYSIGG